MRPSSLILKKILDITESRRNGRKWKYLGIGKGASLRRAYSTLNGKDFAWGLLLEKDWRRHLVGDARAEIKDEKKGYCSLSLGGSPQPKIRKDPPQRGRSSIRSIKQGGDFFRWKGANHKGSQARQL